MSVLRKQKLRKTEYIDQGCKVGKSESWGQNTDLFATEDHSLTNYSNFTFKRQAIRVKNNLFKFISLFGGHS